MQIENSTPADLETIFRFYSAATQYQKKRFPDNTWPQFERSLVETEIAENRQFKLLEDGEIVCVWAVTYNDPELWQDDDGESSLYIHRIATSPEARGRQYVKQIVQWARQFAKDKRFIRMDTCGENTRLIQHYQNCGFEFLGIKKLKDAGSLPAHYHGAEVCYFQIALP